MSMSPDLSEYSKDWNEVREKANLRRENESKGRVAADTRPRWMRRNQNGPKRKGRGSRPQFEKHGTADHAHIFKKDMLRERKRNGEDMNKPIPDVSIQWHEGRPFVSV